MHVPGTQALVAETRAEKILRGTVAGAGFPEAAPHGTVAGRRL